jgi:PAS domain S-box-containing protein
MRRAVTTDRRRWLLSWAALALVGAVAFSIALSWALPRDLADRPQPWETVLVWLVLAAVPVGAVSLWLREGTRQRAVEHEKASRRLTAMIQTGDDLLFEMDSRGTISYLSPNVADYLGYTPEELIGRHANAFLPRREQERAARLFETSAERRAGWTEEPYAFLTKEGDEIPVSSSGVAHIGPNGEVLGFTGTVRRREGGEPDLEEKRARVAGVLEQRALRTVFQPIADVASGAVIGAEALTRFTAEPERSPDQWFAEAHEVGRGLDLELLAVEHALAEARWLPPHLYLSVNLSPESVCSDRLTTILADGGWKPTRLVLEITEHVSVEDYRPLKGSIQQLRGLGLRLAVDDAGAGYASFRHILGLSPDYIKLDRALIDGMDADPARRALVSAVVRFGREVDAAVVAEGVETPAELRTARLLDVDAAQGYFIGRPAPAGPDWAVRN